MNVTEMEQLRNIFKHKMQQKIGGKHYALYNNTNDGFLTPLSHSVPAQSQPMFNQNANGLWSPYQPMFNRKIVMLQQMVDQHQELYQPQELLEIQEQDQDQDQVTDKLNMAKDHQLHHY